MKMFGKGPFTEAEEEAISKVSSSGIITQMNIWLPWPRDQRYLTKIQCCGFNTRPWQQFFYSRL